MSKEKLITIGTLTALFLLAAFSLHAKAAGQEGMVVVRDPLTGKMRAPTPEELRDLRAKAPPSTSLAPRVPTTVSRRDGSRGVRLGYLPQIRDIEDGEMEQIFAGKVDAKAGLDIMVKRGNELLERFQKSVK